MNLSYLYMDSPVGQLRLVANETALVAVLWDCEQPNRVKLATLVEDLQHPVLIETRRQLQEYFAGQRNVLTCLWTLPVLIFRKSLAGATEYSLRTDAKLSRHC